MLHSILHVTNNDSKWYVKSRHINVSVCPKCKTLLAYSPCYNPYCYFCSFDSSVCSMKLKHNHFVFHVRCDMTGFSINCFSDLSGPSIFLVLISWTLTHCIIYSVFSIYIAKGNIPHLLHLSCTKVTCSDCRTVFQAPVPTSKRRVSIHKCTKAFMSNVSFLSNLNQNQNMLTHFSKYLKYDKLQKFICKSPCSTWMER